jgi:hypothetical protein
MGLGLERQKYRRRHLRLNGSRYRKIFIMALQTVSLTCLSEGQRTRFLNSFIGGRKEREELKLDEIAS